MPSLINLYYAFAYPYLSYCIHVWGTTYSTYIEKLFKIQKRMIRIISNSRYLDHTDPLFKKLNLLKISSIYKYSIALLMYKVEYNMIPNVMKHFFVSNTQVHSHNTRQALLFHIPDFKHIKSNSSLIYQGPLIWNALPLHIRGSSSIFSFKSQFKSFLVLNQ